MDTPLLQNILAQPAALRAVGKHHRGAGSDTLAASAALIGQGKRVVLCGMGASLFACIAFGYRLSARGLSVLTVDASELFYFLDAQCDSQTVVVLVSRSGESVEVIKLLPSLRKRGAKVVGIVNVPESTLAKEADLAIEMASPPDELVAIQSYIATLATFALLDAKITGDLETAGAELDRTADLLSKWIPECVESRERSSNFLRTNAPLYLLGRGPTSSSIAEGVLLMHEVAKSPAVGMTIAQFRHGPVEVVDENFRAVIFGTQPVTAPLDAALAKDVERMGGQVRWVGPSLTGLSATQFGSWPSEVPERFLPAAEIVPLQLLAYKKAEILGIRPGQFRWAPTITTSEAGFPDLAGAAKQEVNK